MTDRRLQQGDPDRSQAMEALIQAVGIDLRSSLPGNVTRVASSSPARVDVQPAVGRADRASTDADRYDAVVKDCPVVYPMCGEGGLSFPLAKGDAVLLVFCDRSVVEWVAKGGTGKVPAVDARTHSLTDALAIPLRVGALTSSGSLWLGWLLSYLKQEDGGTMTLSAVAGKLGASAVDGLIKGTTFNTLHGLMLDAMSSAFAGMGTFLGAVVSATAVWNGSGKALADVNIWINAVSTAASTATTPLGAAVIAIAVFKALSSSWTSSIWSVE